MRQLPLRGGGENTPNLVIENHRLTPQNIKDYTQAVLNNLGRKTRSGDIEEVRVILSKDVFEQGANLTKSGTSELQGNDTLMYAVNLTSEQGFVLLSADSRVPVLAIIDQGSFTEIGDNPGFDMFLKMSKPYIDNSIAQYERVSDSINNGADVQTRIIGGYPGGVDKFIELYILDEHLTSKLVSQLLKTQWGQSTAPFNSLFGKCPTHPGEQQAAGCVPVAIAQLLAYHKHPQSARYQIDPRTNTRLVFNYSEMLYRPTPGSEAFLQISNLVKDAAISIGVDYGHDASGDHTTGADSNRNLRTVMQRYGYQKTGSWGPTLPYALNDYRSAEVKQSLDYKRPVYIGGYSYSNKTEGHAWLLDGYMELYRQRVIYERWYSQTYNNYYLKYVSTETWPVDHSLVHCNWGWNGSRNGYFNEGVWNSNKPVDPEFPHNVQRSNIPNYYQYGIGIYSHLRPL